MSVLIAIVKYATPFALLLTCVYDYRLKHVVPEPGTEPHKRAGKGKLLMQFLLIILGLAALGLGDRDTARKEKAAANEKQADRSRVTQEKQQEQERVERQRARDSEDFARKLREERQRSDATIAEFIFQKNDLEQKRIQLIELARNAHLEIKLPQPEPISSTNIERAIESALRSIPTELKAAAAQRDQAEAERIASQVKAREIDKLIRPRVIHVFDLIRAVIAHAQQRGLVMVTNLGPAPVLPERIVYSQQETNVAITGPRPGENILRTNIQQRADFAHGDSLVAYLVVGVVQSTTITNEHMYPKIRIRGMKGNNDVHTIWFDPVSAELRITPRTFNLSEGALESENAVTTNLVEFLKESRLRHNQ